MKSLLSASLVGAFLLFSVPTEASSTNPKFAKPKVVTTFSVLENIVTELAGDSIEVANLVQGGTDPHLFEPGPREIKQVRDSKILFANGLNFEPWLERLVRSASGGTRVVYASREVRPRKIQEHDLDVIDPHAWNSPPELVSYIKVIALELGSAFPDQKHIVDKRSVLFIKKIESLHRRFVGEFSKVPLAERVMLTTHDAAGYIAQTYFIESISPIGLSTSDDFKTADLSRLLIEIRRRKMRVIFTEPSHHRIIAKRLAAKSKLLLGPDLYLDGLSPKNGPANTVEKMLRYNLASILDSMK